MSDLTNPNLTRANHRDVLLDAQVAELQQELAKLKTALKASKRKVAQLEREARMQQAVLRTVQSFAIDQS